jgi:salicylate hydroxylase
MATAFAHPDLAAVLRDGAAMSEAVLIAGGGIGGLAAALALARKGIASHVLERRATFSEEGAGIQIGPNGTRILHDLGVAEALRPHAGVPDAIVVHEARRGTVLARLPLGRDVEARFGAPYWVAHREDLHAALLTRARADRRIRISMGIEAMLAASETDAAGVLTADGMCFAGPVLVGADGVRSVVRAAVCGGTLLQPFGKSAFRSVMAAEHVPAELRDGCTHVWLAPDAHVVHYPVRGGSQVAAVVIADDAFAGEGWSHSARLDRIIERLACASALTRLLRGAADWRKWALIVPAGKGSLAMARGRVALLGDAAHPVLPFLAQGGVLALEDAVVLADKLSRAGADATGALGAYDRARRGRTARVALASRRNGAFYHLGGAPALARNAALRMLPGKALLSRYDWIYGWSGGDAA